MNDKFTFYFPRQPKLGIGEATLEGTFNMIRALAPDESLIIKSSDGDHHICLRGQDTGGFTYVKDWRKDPVPVASTADDSELSRILSITEPAIL